MPRTVLLTFGVPPCPRDNAAESIFVSDFFVHDICEGERDSAEAGTERTRWADEGTHVPRTDVTDHGGPGGRGSGRAQFHPSGFLCKRRGVAAGRLRPWDLSRRTVQSSVCDRRALHDFHRKIADDDGRRSIAPVGHDVTVRVAGHALLTLRRLREEVAHVAMQILVLHAAWEYKVTTVVRTTCTDETIAAPYFSEHLV